ncbi:nuclear transport factor 2 family protein [uncultured Litoreibacter sp.]|uniref:nuclear transport factor 2 family protein n=1 Tax=uncultured Litoreibacter sp. TaxID=1392394 RepID=UPI0026155DD9|nr:nuclear transport factor 2 family protein [uncultured Litoreibacter sp.]
MTDKDQIIATVTHYIEGIRDGSGARVAKAFYSSVNLNSLDADGNLVLTPRSALEALADSGTLPPNTSEITEIEINNDMALVKVTIDLPTFQFFDLLTLLRLNVGWKIVSKTYTTVNK